METACHTWTPYRKNGDCIKSVSSECNPVATQGVQTTLFYSKVETDSAGGEWVDPFQYRVQGYVWNM